MVGRAKLPLMARFAEWWREYQRSLDKKILWPICKRETGSIEDARHVFMVHAAIDPAWEYLGKDVAWIIIEKWS
jgi:hypothetical protein